jgi:hypothetical protein
MKPKYFMLKNLPDGEIKDILRNLYEKRAGYFGKWQFKNGKKMQLATNTLPFDQAMKEQKGIHRQVMDEMRENPQDIKFYIKKNNGKNKISTKNTSNRIVGRNTGHTTNFGG